MGSGSAVGTTRSRRTYGTQAGWVELYGSNRRVKTRRYRIGRADGTGMENAWRVSSIQIAKS